MVGAFRSISTSLEGGVVGVASLIGRRELAGVGQVVRLG